MNEGKQAYPLLWPAGWKRSVERKRSRFGHGYNVESKPSMAYATDEVLRELELMKAHSVVISSNIILRNDGFPRSGQPIPKDPGVAVYFKRKGKDQVLQCDTFDLPGCNLYAISRTVNALRQMERDGCGDMMERAFTGFKALPEFAEQSWRSVLQLPARCEWDSVVHAYRSLAKKYHPDNQETGDAEKFKQIANAYDEAKKEYKMESVEACP